MHLEKKKKKKKKKKIARIILTFWNIVIYIFICSKNSNTLFKGFNNKGDIKIGLLK